MEPIYALSLTFEGLALLRKAQSGWIVLGDVSLDDPDLSGALAALRDSGGQGADEVKLILPNEQIKYLELKDRGSTGPVLDAQIQAALDGATPYDVLELRYDHSKQGEQLFVAAVAKETLAEAEAFAEAQGFKPVSFCAVAAPGQFEGEVYFGAANSWTGPAPVKADSALRIIAAPAIDEIIEEPADPAAEIPAPQPEPVEPTPEPEVMAAPAPEPEVDAQPEPEAEQPAKEPSLAAAIASPEIQEPRAPAPAFTSIRAKRSDEASAAPRLNGADKEAPAAQSGPSLTAVTDAPATAFKSKPVFGAALAEEPSAKNGAEPKGPKGRTLGFFSRRKSDQPVPDAPAEEAPKAPKPSPMSVATSALRGKPKPEAVIEDPAVKTAEEQERERMTIFGQREQQKIGGKPRFLGLMLTAALLLFLAGVAAWASVFLDTGLARLFSPTDGEVIELGESALPDPVQQTEIAPAEAEIELAALDTGLDGAGIETDLIEDEILSSPIVPQVLTAEEAEATYAATGIWQRSPNVPEVPQMIGLGEVYTTNLDPTVVQHDAVALQAPRDHASDMAFAGLANPVPPETKFILDDRGFVLATVEGALNPEGVLIYLGEPPVTAPIRPAEAALLAEDPELLAQRIRMQIVRPRLRPDNVQEDNERNTFGGFSLAELAKIRPLARPVTEKELAEQDTTATAQAIDTSRRPITRPRNFATTVAAAIKKQVSTDSAPRATQVAATIAPKIPSSASVAKQATVTNAISLNKVNLIGVYGKPSSRRALVRLANGRYKKVQVGDTVDGGRVAAIGESELRYVKGGRNLVLKLPQG